MTGTLRFHIGLLDAVECNCHSGGFPLSCVGQDTADAMATALAGPMTGSKFVAAPYAPWQDTTLMNRLHIVGRKNHGKTTLVAELVVHFTNLGLSVATIKHTHHAHELDTPGKDSFCHRQAGADVVGIVARNLSAAFWPTPAGDSNPNDQYEQFARLTEECDLVLVEGDLQATSPKIEVWRAAIGPAPLAVEDDSILAVVSDDPAPVTCDTYPRRDLSLLAERIQHLWLNEGR